MKTADQNQNLRPNSPMDKNRTDSIVRKGKEIFKLSDSFEPNFFSNYALFSKGLGFMDDRPLLKLQAFRFADLFPSLKSFSQISRYIRLYFLETKVELPKPLLFLLSILLSNPFTSSFAAWGAKLGIEFVAKFFILGRNYKTGRNKILSRYRNGVSTTIDILGEAVLSEKEAAQYSRKYLELLEGISKDTKLAEIRSKFFSKEPTGNVSVKCSSIYSQLDPLAHIDSVSRLKEKLRPILDSAISKNIFINLDMEQYETKEIILDTALEIFSETGYADYPHFGIVIQAYLRSSQRDLIRVIQTSEKRKHPLTVRLVKGAYWEYEVIQAGQKGWEPPVFLQKSETDKNYEECANILLNAYPKIRPAFASHNIRSLSSVLVQTEEYSIPKDFFEIQMLYGMGDSYKKAIRHLGIGVREYSPIGEVIPGMAYLVRRLLENSTNEGFLRNINTNKKDREQLLYLETRPQI